MSENSQRILKEVLHHMGFEAEVTLNDYPEGPWLDIHCDEAGRLIGRQGKTLSALQFIVNRLVYQQDSSAPKITVDVGKYRGKNRDELVRKAHDAAKKVARWGDVVEMEPLNAYDRRIIHNVLKDDPKVETSSVEVEGTSKKAIILRPRSS